MPNTTGTNSTLDTLDIRKKIKVLEFLGESKTLTALTNADIKIFKKLLNKSNRIEKDEVAFNNAAEKIIHIFSLYDEVVSKSLSEGKFNRSQLKVLLEKRYWQEIVQAYEAIHQVNLDGLEESDRRRIYPICKEYMKYAEQAILCLLDVSDFSNNANFNNSSRIASLAEFDDRYFERHEVKHSLEQDQRLFTEVLNFYPTDHEISELKSKYLYVNHFFALVDYHRALPKISESLLVAQNDFMQGLAHDISPVKFKTGQRKSLLSNFNPLSPEFFTPASKKSRYSMGSNVSPDLGTLSNISSMMDPESQDIFEIHEANRNSRALVLPNIVSPHRVSDRKKLAHLQQYFIDFLLSDVDGGYLNMLILDACLLNQEIDYSDLEENVDKNFAFDYLMKNRSLFLKMLNMLPGKNPDEQMDSSVLTKAIACIKSTKNDSFQQELKKKYQDAFSAEEIDPIKLEELTINLLAWELNNNEDVFKRVFIALSRMEPNLSDGNKKKWLDLLIELSLHKPEYATKLLDRRYCFKWFSNQAKAYLEIDDIKTILLGTLKKDASGEKPRYDDAQISLVFSRRFFYLVRPDAMKFTGEDLIDLLAQGQSDSLSRAIATNTTYLNKILHALNMRNSLGDTKGIRDVLINLHNNYPVVFNSLEKQYGQFKDAFKPDLVAGVNELFTFPELFELGFNQTTNQPNLTKLLSTKLTNQSVNHSLLSRKGTQLSIVIEEPLNQNDQGLSVRSDLSINIPQLEEETPEEVSTGKQESTSSSPVDTKPAWNSLMNSIRLKSSQPFDEEKDEGTYLGQQRLSPVYTKPGLQVSTPRPVLPKFLQSIQSNGEGQGFFSEHKKRSQDSKKRISSALQAIFDENKIELKTGSNESEWLDFTRCLQEVKDRKAATQLIKDKVVNKIQGLESGVQEISDNAEDSFDNDEYQQTNDPSVISTECCKAVVDSIVTKCKKDFTWAQQQTNSVLSMKDLLSLRIGQRADSMRSSHG